MKRVLLFFILLTTLTGCSSKSGEEILENKYQDCTVETCSKEMLIDRIEVAATTTDGYKGESKDAEEALVKLYGVTYKEVKELKNLQFAVDSLEEGTLKEDCSEYCYYVDRYVKAISECGGKCNSEFITYEEIKDLTIDEAINLAKGKREEYLANSPSTSGDKVTDSSSSTHSSSSSGNIGSSSTTSSSSSSSNTNKIERIPIATCKFSNPVDCAVDYINKNYDVSWKDAWWDGETQAYQNTKTKDYVIYVTVKGENVFGGTVQNTFEVTTDEDSKYVYSCIQK